jgi:hypothetical protein
VNFFLNRKFSRIYTKKNFQIFFPIFWFEKRQNLAGKKKHWNCALLTLRKRHDNRRGGCGQIFNTRPILGFPMIAVYPVRPSLVSIHPK